MSERIGADQPGTQPAPNQVDATSRAGAASGAEKLHPATGKLANAHSAPAHNASAHAMTAVRAAIRQMSWADYGRLWWSSLKASLWSLISGEMSLVAAGCAFYATLALFPAITTLISLYGLAFNPITVEPQLLYLRHLMPPATFQLIGGRIQQLVSGGKTSLGIGLVVSLMFTLYSTASGTKSLIYALNVIHKREETRGIIRFQLVTLGMTLVGIIGAIIAIGVLVGLPLLFAFFGFGKASALLAVVIGFLLLVGFMGVALGLFYRFGPSFRKDLGHTIIPGVVVAILLWVIVSYGFAVYVGQFAAYSRTYGPLATIIGLMMWFYLTAYTLLLGALFNAGIDRMAVAGTPPDRMAVAGTP